MNTVPIVDPTKMSWALSRIDYTQETTFTGIDTMYMLIEDAEGAYSDRVTLQIILLEMPCLHGGECLGNNCFRISFNFYFFDNLTS